MNFTTHALEFFRTLPRLLQQDKPIADEIVADNGWKKLEDNVYFKDGLIALELKTPNCRTLTFTDEIPLRS